MGIQAHKGCAHTDTGLGWNKLKMIEQDPYSEVFRTNNHHNNGSNRNDNIEGKPPKYSNQRQIPIKNMKLNNINSEDNVSCENNSSWLFSKSSGSNSADINPRMYVLKRTIDEVRLPNTDDFNNDSINFDWKYLMRKIPLSDELFQFTIFQQHQSDVIIHEFLEKNVIGKINYNHLGMQAHKGCAHTDTS